MKNFLSKIILFNLEKLRKISKSLGKYQDYFRKKIIIEQNKNINRKKFIRNYDFSDLLKNLDNDKFLPKKIAIVICFYFNKKNINELTKTCRNLKNLGKKIDVTIITNDIKKNKKIFLSRKLKLVLKKFKIISHNIPEPNLLPWFSISVMKQKILDKSFSHFLYLEHDILLYKKNLIYWSKFRTILKSKNLIPAFLRTEKNKNNEIFVVDAINKINLKNDPKIYINSKNDGFINNRYPYQAIYLMDRDLMKEYLNSPASTVDFGFFNQELRNKYPIKELVNVSIAYFNIPNGYYNRYVIPFTNKKEIPDFCLIEHSSNKYVNLKNKFFSKINIKELLY